MMHGQKNIKPVICFLLSEHRKRYVNPPTFWRKNLPSVKQTLLFWT